MFFQTNQQNNAFTANDALIYAGCSFVFGLFCALTASEEKKLLAMMISFTASAVFGGLSIFKNENEQEFRFRKFR